MQLQEIAERCQQGDREAFALLYTATREQLRTVCMRYIKNETVADDLLHDAFLLIFSKIGELKEPACIEAWMTSVIRRVALLYLRQQKQLHQVPLAEVGETIMPTAENRADSMLALQEIIAAVNILPKGYRQVFRLSVLEGMTHQEIAALLRIEPHSSSSQLFHAKALLRQWLRPMLLLLLIVALPVGISLWLRRPSLTPPIVQEQNVITPIPSDTSAFAKTDATVPLHSREGVAKGRGSIYNTPVANKEEAHEKTNEEIELLTPPFEGKEEKIVVLPADSSLDPENFPYEYHEMLQPIGSSSQWQIELAYSDMGTSSAMQLPYADAETNPIVYDSLSHHRLPLTVTLSLSRRLGQHWQVGTGLNYTRLTSEFCSGNSYVSLQQHQTVQYLGIPVSISYHWPLSHSVQLFISSSATLHLPLRSTLDSHYLLPDGTQSEFTTGRLHPGKQWSVGMGLGIQYNLTPHVSFFVEPSLQHFFQNNSGVNTWNTEHSFIPSLPFGVKFTF